MNKQRRESIYLDYSATTPVAPEVTAAMLPYLRETFGNASSLHEYGRNAAAALDEARRLVDEGIATADDIDLAMRLGAGWTNGPLAGA